RNEMSQESAQGGVDSYTTRLTRSTLNCSPPPPNFLKWAFEVRTMIVPESVSPGLGKEIKTVGGVLSTVILSGAEVAMFPAVSRAAAVRVWDPSRAAVVFHETA